MKRFILYFILFICFQANAQREHFINFGFRTQASGLTEMNHIIDYYNQARPWLSKQLGKQHFQSGFEFGIEGSDDKFGMGFLKYYHVWNSSSAKGTLANGNEVKRELKTVTIALEAFDIWYTPIKIAKLRFGFGIMPIGIGRFKIKTRVDDNEWLKSNFDYLPSTKKVNPIYFDHAYTNYHIDITNGGRLHIQLFYTQNWFRDKYDLYYLNKELNPINVSNYNRRTLLKVENVGLKLTYSI